MNDLMKTERTKNEELINDSIQEVKKKVFENLSLENQVFVLVKFCLIKVII